MGSIDVAVEQTPQRRAMCSALWILGMTWSTWIGAGHSFFPVGCVARIQANQIFSFRRTRTMATPEHSRTKLLLIQAVRTACMSCSNSHKYLSSPWRSSEDSTVVRFVWSMDMTQGRIEHVRRIIVRSTCTSVYQCTPSMSVEKLPTVYRTCVGCQTMHPPLLSVHRKNRML